MHRSTTLLLQTTRRRQGGPSTTAASCAATERSCNSADPRKHTNTPPHQRIGIMLPIPAVVRQANNAMTKKRRGRGQQAFGTQGSSRGPSQPLLPSPPSLLFSSPRSSRDPRSNACCCVALRRWRRGDQQVASHEGPKRRGMATRVKGETGRKGGAVIFFWTRSQSIEDGSSGGTHTALLRRRKMTRKVE